MGGSSSKAKKTSPKTNCKPDKKGKGKGKKSKGEKKGSAQWNRSDGTGGEVTFTPGRRKSSEDTEDFKPPPVRGRSKSLRFCDFTQLDRQHKVDDNDLLPVDIAFFQDGKVDPEDLCHVCSVYTGSETLLCGVCYRVFHEGCLAKIGQWSGPLGPMATSGMWSCHQCANLGNLLTEQEVIDVLKRLDECGIRREDDLSLADYMAYCHMSLQKDEGKVLTREKADNARRRFGQVDTANKGRITWCQFLNIETVRILKKRSKNALVRLLTKPELERARDAFRILDKDKDGRITKALAHEALDRNSRRSGYYPDETMMYIDEDLDELVSWTEFLMDRAIYIIAERPCLRTSPLDQSTRRRSSNRSTIADASALDATGLTRTPPLPHGKGVVRSMSQATVKPVLVAPLCKQPGKPHMTVLRHSDGSSPVTKPYPSVQVSAMVTQGRKSSEVTTEACTNHASAPTSPTRKQSGGLPTLPPPPSSSRASSHQQYKGGGSVPTTPVRTSDQEFFPHHVNPAGHAYRDSSAKRGSAHSDGSAHRGSAHSDGSAGVRLSGGSDSGAGGGQRLSGHSEQQGFSSSFRRENAGNVRHSSQGDSMGNPGSGSHHVTGKPPMGNHGRAVAAPPYGKLVERVQKGDYRQTQARSMHLTSSSHPQATPTFGHVTGDTSTGRRPLSLV